MTSTAHHQYLHKKSRSREHTHVLAYYNRTWIPCVNSHSGTRKNVLAGLARFSLMSNMSSLSTCISSKLTSVCHTLKKGTSFSAKPELLYRKKWSKPMNRCSQTSGVWYSSRICHVLCRFFVVTGWVCWRYSFWGDSWVFGARQKSSASHWVSAKRNRVTVICCRAAL